MAASSDQNDNGMITNINVTPLVDVILVLLIIFMATAPMIHQRSLDISVPQAAHNEAKATDALAIQFTAAQDIYVKDEKVPAEELAALLDSHYAVNPALHVSVSADESIPYGGVVGLLDIVRGVGIKKVALDVRSK